MKNFSKSNAKIYAGIIISFLTASLFFCTLYFFNNKYTHTATQAINGLLIISHEDLNKNPYRFLWNDWTYYPNVLLSPDDFKSGEPDIYMTYTNIQSSGRMDLLQDTNKSRFGCGTYMMRIKVSDYDACYALDIPEIFSACNIYINDKKMLSMGNPEPDGYKAVTGNRLITFFPDENGIINIMIAVNNQSYFYSGIIYPPAFGTPEALNYIRGIRLGMRLCVVFSFIITILVCIYFWIKTHNPISVYLALLSILMIGWTSYPLVHILFILPVFPVYWIEMLCCYLTFAVMVFMHNRVCSTSKILTYASNLISFGFCIFISVCFLSSKYFSDYMVNVMSEILAVYKLILSAYLITTSFMAARKKLHLRQLLYVSVFLGTACLWDRIFPAYEPIFGGWFIEWVCTVLIYILAVIMWNFLIENYTRNKLLEQQNKNSEKQIIMQTNYTFQLKEQMEERRRFVHDFKHHLRVIHTMAERSGNQEILSYLDSADEYRRSNISQNTEIYCGNPAIDALLFYYENIAQIKNISVSIQFQLTDDFPVSDVELCTILGNLLENAVEACLHISDGNIRKITLKTACKPSLWYMTIENTFDGEIIPENKRNFRTRKNNSNYHGIGISSVRTVVEKYKGSFDIQTDNSIFRAGITIPLDKIKNIK